MTHTHPKHIPTLLAHTSKQSLNGYPPRLCDHHHGVGVLLNQELRDTRRFAATCLTRDDGDAMVLDVC
jgi:hypothetical protein